MRVGRNPIWNLTFLVLLAIGWTCVAPSKATAQAETEKTKKLKKELEDLQKKVEELKKKEATLAAEIAEMNKQYAKVEIRGILVEQTVNRPRIPGGGVVRRPSLGVKTRGDFYRLKWKDKDAQKNASKYIGKAVVLKGTLVRVTTRFQAGFVAPGFPGGPGPGGPAYHVVSHPGIQVESISEVAGGEAGPGVPPGGAGGDGAKKKAKKGTGAPGALPGFGSGL